MSKIIRREDWRELAHYIELDNGKKIYIDSCYVWGRGFETLCREVNDKCQPLPGANFIRIGYVDYDKMVAEHYEICNKFEDYVERKANE